MSDSFSRDFVNQLRGLGAVDPRDAEIERLTARAEKAEAEIERLTSLVSDSEAQRYASCSILLSRAKKAEAERDEARAQVAAAYKVAADTVFAPKWWPKTSCDWVQARIAGEVRALTPSDAKAALEAYGRKKMWEGMQRVIDRLRHEGHINQLLTYGDAIEWAEYVLNEIEKDADQ